MEECQEGKGEGATRLRLRENVHEMSNSEYNTMIGSKRCTLLNNQPSLDSAPLPRSGAAAP
ncbi:hypothetical protein E2C01_049991 [Portunus trituberculatus]|uniref:Uncharacterized protein n=1 Tax=Portunus trituberculatus TaxID=210409 RepID=A0A5B7GAW4_PORTR|nr:hypothetical protein [Portunus trituberculatus]